MAIFFIIILSVLLGRNQCYINQVLHQAVFHLMLSISSLSALAGITANKRNKSVLNVANISVQNVNMDNDRNFNMSF